MPSYAFLTMADMSDFVSDDELTAALLRQRGWRVDSLPWDQPVDWSQYDLVVIRTTWDYHERPFQFLNVLAQIEHSETRLLNPLSLVRWNMDKKYLRDLEKNDVPIVPTVYAGHLASRDQLLAYFLDFDAQEIILKPQVNVNAFDTYRLPKTKIDALYPELKTVFAGRPFMAQPFMPAIPAEGEFSLIYLNGQYSHAILKTPTSGDFRVQEEHGGLITAVKAEEGLLEAGRRAMNALQEIPLYARVDLVRSRDAFLIMELELIEPSLYLRMHPDAPERFANALTAVL